MSWNQNDRKNHLLSLAERLKLTPSDSLINLLDNATTHPSAKSFSTNGNYERLEFLGDSVLGLAIADLLYHGNPKSSEGDLSAMKSAATKKNTLAEFGKFIGIDEYIQIADGIEIQDSIREDIIESIFGAIYITHGLAHCMTLIKEETKAFSPIFEELQTSITRVNIEGRYLQKSRRTKVLLPNEPIPLDWGSQNNPKNWLQETLQHQGLPLPKYETIDKTGPAHKPTFIIKVICTVDNLMYSSVGKGNSKREAELRAAQSLYTKLRQVGKA